MDYGDVMGAVKIKDGLFIGDQYAATDMDFMNLNKVTHVINCSGREIANHYEQMGVKYLTYFWMNTESQVILDARDAVMKEVFDFAQEALDVGESVLIHSNRGQDRSYVVLTAFLMKRYNWTYSKAQEFMASRRPDIKPKPGQVKQLNEFESRLAKQNRLSSSWTTDHISELSSEEFVMQNTFINASHPFQNHVHPDPNYRDVGPPILASRLRWADANQRDRSRLEIHDPNTGYNLAELKAKQAANKKGNKFAVPNSGVSSRKGYKHVAILSTVPKRLLPPGVSQFTGEAPERRNSSAQMAQAAAVEAARKAEQERLRLAEEDRRLEAERKALELKEKEREERRKAREEEKRRRAEEKARIEMEERQEAERQAALLKARQEEEARRVQEEQERQEKEREEKRRRLRELHAIRQKEEKERMEREARLSAERDQLMAVQAEQEREERRRRNSLKEADLIAQEERRQARSSSSSTRPSSSSQQREEYVLYHNDSVQSMGSILSDNNSLTLPIDQIGNSRRPSSSSQQRDAFAMGAFSRGPASAPSQSRGSMQALNRSGPVRSRADVTPTNAARGTPGSTPTGAMMGGLGFGNIAGPSSSSNRPASPANFRPASPSLSRSGSNTPLNNDFYSQTSFGGQQRGRSPQHGASLRPSSATSGSRPASPAGSLRNNNVASAAASTSGGFSAANLYAQQGFSNNDFLSQQRRNSFPSGGSNPFLNGMMAKGPMMGSQGFGGDFGHKISAGHLGRRAPSPSPMLPSSSASNQSMGGSGTLLRSDSPKPRWRF